jgi:hypothetical protein
MHIKNQTANNFKKAKSIENISKEDMKNLCHQMKKTATKTIDTWKEMKAEIKIKRKRKQVTLLTFVLIFEALRSEFLDLKMAPTLDYLVKLKFIPRVHIQSVEQFIKKVKHHCKPQEYDLIDEEPTNDLLNADPPNSYDDLQTLGEKLTWQPKMLDPSLTSQILFLLLLCQFDKSCLIVTIDDIMGWIEFKFVTKRGRKKIKRRDQGNYENLAKLVSLVIKHVYRMPPPWKVKADHGFNPRAILSCFLCYVISREGGPLRFRQFCVWINEPIEPSMKNRSGIEPKDGVLRRWHGFGFYQKPSKGIFDHLRKGKVSEKYQQRLLQRIIGKTDLEFMILDATSYKRPDTGKRETKPREIKHGLDSKKKPLKAGSYEKIHLAGAVTSKGHLLILSMTHTRSWGKGSGDCTQGLLLLKSMGHLYSFEELLADGAYYFQEIYKYCREILNVRATIRVKGSKKPTSKLDCDQREDAKVVWKRGLQFWKLSRKYGRRWLIETLISALKVSQTDKLHSRKFEAQTAEMFARSIGYNLSVILRHAE